VNYFFEDNLKEIIINCGDNVNVDVNKINEETDLIIDLSYNSINIIQLVVDVESIFNIEIDDEDLLQEKLTPYKSLVKILAKKINIDKTS